MKKILIVVLLFCFGRVYAQDKKIDSLINLLKTTKSDTEKVCIQSDLLNFYAQYNDSTSFYKTYQQAYQLAEKINYPEGKIVLLNRLAHFYVLNSSVVKSKNALIKAEDIAKSLATANKIN